MAGVSTDSILNDIKKRLGIAEDYTHFDEDLIMDANTVFMILNQMGIGPTEGFSIVDSTATWGDFISDLGQLQGVKTYVKEKVRLMFDPPQSSATMEAVNANIAELEWRLFITQNPTDTFSTTT